MIILVITLHSVYQISSLLFSFCVSYFYSTTCLSCGSVYTSQFSLAKSTKQCSLQPKIHNLFDLFPAFLGLIRLLLQQNWTLTLSDKTQVRSDCCVLICLNEPHREWKHTRVQFKQTQHFICERNIKKRGFSFWCHQYLTIPGIE